MSDAPHLFYSPSKQLITCESGYILDTFSPESPQFEEKFDRNFVFNTKSDKTDYHLDLSHKVNITKFIHEDDKYISVKIISVPLNPNTQLYLIQEVVSVKIRNISHNDILDSNPSLNPALSKTTLSFPLFPLATHHGKCTLFLHATMAKLKQSHLSFKDEELSFVMGCNKTGKSTPLLLLYTNIESLITSKT